MSEVHKYKNRMKFGTDAEEEFRATGIGFGMLSQAHGSGRVKINIDKDKRIPLNKNL